jgi:hypothetical protein
MSDSELARLATVASGVANEYWGDTARDLRQAASQLRDAVSLRERLRVCQEQNTALERAAEKECDRIHRARLDALEQRDDQRARANRLAAFVRWFQRGGIGVSPSLEPGDLGDEGPLPKENQQ